MVLIVCSVFAMGTSQGGYSSGSSSGADLLLSIIPFIILAYFVGCLALGGWLASEKGYSVGFWIMLLLFFGVLALIVLVGAPGKNSQETLRNIIYKNNNLDMARLKIIFTNIDKNINVNDFESYILENKDKVETIYKILKINGKEAMNEYLKSILYPNKVSVVV
jgi:hypothetical protein